MLAGGFGEAEAGLDGHVAAGPEQDQENKH